MENAKHSPNRQHNQYMSSWIPISHSSHLAQLNSGVLGLLHRYFLSHLEVVPKTKKWKLVENNWWWNDIYFEDRVGRIFRVYFMGFNNVRNTQIFKSFCTSLQLTSHHPSLPIIIQIFAWLKQLKELIIPFIQFINCAK